MASDGTLKFDTSLDSGGLQSGMGKVASIAQQALGVFSGQMMTRAVDSLVNLGKTALSSVGALEQNVGGVETLFGDTADAVIAAADRAYKTAGMSANDYMSTVTSFSASLLQSLSGNTEEAAQVADMAIIDMADNANKMGTSMDKSQKSADGALESRAGWKGLCRKGTTLLVVLVACRLDLVTGSTFIRDAAIIAFIANETLSIIENAGLMGVPIPAIVVKAIDILKQKAEDDANISPGKE